MTDKKPERDVAADLVRHGRDMQKVNDKLRDLINTFRPTRSATASPP